MTVSELLEIIGGLDPHLDVKFVSHSGVGFDNVTQVEVETERSPYDSDFDKSIVVIR